MTSIKTFNRLDNKTKITLSITVIIVLIISGWVYYKSNLGGIDVYIQKKETSIFLDNKKIGTSKKDNDIVKIRGLSDGEYFLLINKQGHSPWRKNITIKDKEIKNIRTFSLPNSFDSYVKTVDFGGKENEIIDNISKTISESKISYDKNVMISKDGNKITATWIGEEESLPDFFCDNEKCDNNSLVLSSSTGIIKNIGFYPGRNDLILFAVGNGIFAIEIDRKDIQNFQPLYVGQSPSFSVDRDISTLYIKDFDSIVGIVL